MKKLIIVKFNPQLGPEPIQQYPPDPNFPKKEVFLRIWAQHKMQSDSKFVEFENEHKYLSIIQKIKNEVYFLILQLEKNVKFTAFQDILNSMAEPLFSAIGTAQLTRIIVDTYNQIDEYSKLNKVQLFFNLFNDMDKISIFEILQNGVIDKRSLADTLKDRWGISEKNLDLLINPFFNLDLIEETDIPGIEGCLFLVKDVLFCRLPPEPIVSELKGSNDSADRMYISELQEFYKNYQLESKEEINKLAKLLSDRNLYKSLEILYENRLKKERFMSIISQDVNLFQRIKDATLIIEIEDFIYPMSKIEFIKFTPIYLMRKLKKRYENKEISTDQFLYHINLLRKELEKNKSR